MMSDKLVEAVAEFLSRDPNKPAFSSIEELSTDTLNRYKAKASAVARSSQAAARYGDPDDVDSRISAGKVYDKRKKGLSQANARLNKEETELEEQAHKVSVTVSDPNHPMMTKRNERMEKRVIVNAENRDQAIVKAKQHYSKKGMKVHSAEYHSLQPASTMK
jgi:hypothetical protein